MCCHRGRASVTLRCALPPFALRLPVAPLLPPALLLPQGALDAIASGGAQGSAYLSEYYLGPSGLKEVLHSRRRRRRPFKLRPLNRHPPTICSHNMGTILSPQPLLEANSSTPFADSKAPHEPLPPLALSFSTLVSAFPSLTLPFRAPPFSGSGGGGDGGTRGPSVSTAGGAAPPRGRLRPGPRRLQRLHRALRRLGRAAPPPSGMRRQPRRWRCRRHQRRRHRRRQR